MSDHNQESKSEEKASCATLRRLTWDPIRLRVNRELGRAFFWFGTKIAGRPLLSIGLSLLIVIICGCGALLMKTEFRTEYLWAPISSRGFKDFEEHLKTFGTDRAQSIALIATDAANNNLLEKSALLELVSIHERIMGITVRNRAGANVKLIDFCKKDPGSTSCTIGSFLSIWGFNSTIIEEDPDPGQTISPFADNLRSLIGGVERDSNGKVVMIRAAFITYLIPNAFYDIEENTVLRWEEQFLTLKDLETNYVDIGVMAGRSIDDEINRLVGQDTMYVVISFLLTLIYMSAILGKRNWVQSKVLLGSASLFTIVLALGISYGIGGYFGVPFTTLSGLVIFIVVGVGVDGMIIIVDSYEEMTDRSLSIEERLPIALSQAGPTITLTSTTTFLAFMISSFSDLPSIRFFNISAALAVFALYILQLTFFSGVLIYDARRVQAKRVDCLPCIKLSDEKAPPEVETPGVVRNFIAKYYGPFLMRLPTRLIVLVLFLGLAAISAYSSNHLDVGIRNEDGLPDDTYLLKFFDYTNIYFGDAPRTLYLVTRKIDYTDPDNHIKLRRLHDDFYEIPGVTIPPLTSWFNSFEIWLDTNNITLTRSNFYPQLNTFLSLPQYITLTQDLIFDDDGTIRASSFRGTCFFKGEVVQRVDDMKILRNTFDAIGVNGYVYSNWIMYSDRDEVITWLIISTLLLGASAVFVTLMIFLTPPTAFLIALCIILIDADLLGLMYVWGIPIDATSFICLAMAVGLSVDYCSHVGLAYFNAQGTTNKELIRNALTDIGTSVFNGGFSTLLGISVLAFTNSEAFRIFFKMLLGIIGFGLIHGLIMFPVMATFLPKYFTPLTSKKVQLDNKKLELKEFKDTLKEEQMKDIEKEESIDKY